MKSILEKAKQVARKENKAKEEQKLREEKVYKGRQSLKKRIEDKVIEILMSLNGKRTKRGTIKISGNEAYIKGAEGYNDQFLFRLEYDSWMRSFRGSDESCEEEYYSQGVMIKSLNNRRYLRDDKFSEERFSVGDYEFDKKFESVEAWLVNFFKDLV